MAACANSRASPPLAVACIGLTKSITGELGASRLPLFGLSGPWGPLAHPTVTGHDGLSGVTSQEVTIGQAS